MRPRGAGFTLLEILVALGIVAVVSVTIYGRIGELVQQGGMLEQRTFGTWVAQDALVRLQLEYRGTQTPVPTGRRTDTVASAGRDWTVTTEILATDDPVLRRVEIGVVPAELDAAGVEGSVARLVGFLGRY
jgi:general secretion pathway protein I